MLLTYKIQTPEIDEITVMSLGQDVTQQLYYKEGKIIKRDTAVWGIKNSILVSVHTGITDFLLVPNELDGEQIKHVDAAAFIHIQTNTVIFPMCYKVSFSERALLHVPIVKVHCIIKRSQITPNMQCFGRILEDVYNRP